MKPSKRVGNTIALTAFLERGAEIVVELNERAKEYLTRAGWKHIVLSVEDITS